MICVDQFKKNYASDGCWTLQTIASHVPGTFIFCTECCTIFLVSQDNQRPSGFNRQVKIPRPEALCTNNYGGIGSVSRNVRESQNLKIFPKPTWLDCDREKRCFKSWQSVVRSAFLVGKKSPASSKYFWTLRPCQTGAGQD